MGIFSSLAGGSGSRAQARAAERAAASNERLQREAIQAATAQQERAIQFQEDAFSDAAGFLDPLIGDNPTGALDKLRALTGAAGTEKQQSAFDNLVESPDIAFLREQGLRGLSNNAAVSGNLGGGNLQRDQIALSSGLALQNLQNTINNLSNVANVDLDLTQGKANLRTGLGSAQANAATNIGNIQGSGLSNIGNIQAQGINDAARFRTQGNLLFGNAADQGIQSLLGFVNPAPRIS